MGGVKIPTPSQILKSPQKAIAMSPILRADPIIGGLSGTFKSPTGLINMNPGLDRPPPINIGGSAGGAGMTDVDGAALYNRQINQAAMDDFAAGRSANTNALLAQAMGMSKGLSGAENAALRSNALSQIQQQQGAATRDLRGQLASQGVRGGLAAALNQQQAAKGVEAVSGAERNLVADNFNNKMAGLQTAAMMNTNQENIERDLMRGRLETILTLRGQNMGLQGAQMQAQAAANAGRGGKK